MTLAELAEVIEAGQTDGLDAAIKKSVELTSDSSKIRATLRKQRELRTVRVKSKLSEGDAELPDEGLPEDLEDDD